MDSQLRFTLVIASRLESAGIAYMLTGSMALAVYGVPRMTRDIDLVVECAPGDAPRIAGLFRADCYVEEEEIREAVATRSIFNLIHNEWIVKADFIVRKDDEYRRQEFTRRRNAIIAGATVKVVAPEDLILSKLAWSRLSGSELQLRDVRTLLATDIELDHVYLDKWAAVLELSSLLTEVRG